MIKMLHVDCMEYMKSLPDKAFSLAIVDPPYGIDINSQNMGDRSFKPTNKDWDNAIPTKEYFDELFRVSENQIIWGGNYFNLPSSRYFTIWDKGESMYGRDFAECEYAWVSSGGTRIFKQHPNQLDRIHPTQKPVDLYKWLLSKYAKPGHTILDTHGGSGSIAIACHDLGYDLTWMELDKDYFDSACERYKKHALQISLFEPEKEQPKNLDLFI